MRKAERNSSNKNYWKKTFEMFRLCCEKVCASLWDLRGSPSRPIRKWISVWWLARLMGDDASSSWSDGTESKKLPERCAMCFERKWFKRPVRGVALSGSRRGWRWFQKLAMFTCLDVMEEQVARELLSSEVERKCLVMYGAERLWFCVAGWQETCGSSVLHGERILALVCA